MKRFYEELDIKTVKQFYEVFDNNPSDATIKLHKKNAVRHVITYDNGIQDRERCVPIKMCTE